MNYRIKKWLKRKNNKINPFKFTWKVNFLFYLTIQQHRWAYPEDSTPQSCQRANLLFFLEKNIYFGPHCYILHSRQKIKKKNEEVKFLSTHRDFLFFAFFIINSWYIKAWLVVWLSFRWWFFRMKWHVVWQFEFIKIFVASSVLCTDLEKGIFFFIFRGYFLFFN